MPIRDERRIAVVVLGMHRSGTSALARVLSLLGCDLPQTLLAANPTNKTGHWESLPISQLNDRILESGGSNWHDWTEFNPRWRSSPKATEFRVEALALLQAEFGNSHLFVLKDPRICRLLPFWRELLDETDIKPLFFLPVRNPLEVAASLSTRDGFETALGHLIWLRNVLDAELSSRGLPRIFTTFNQLMDGWEPLLLDAQSVLGVDWPRQSYSVAAEVDAFLSASHRHHRESRAAVVENPALSAWLRDSYAVLGGWARDGEQEAGFAVLDRIRSELNAAAPAFAQLIETGRQAGAKVVTLTGEIDNQTRIAAAAESSLANLRHRLAETESALAQRSLEAEESSAQLAEARKALASGYNDLQQANAERADLDRRLNERFDEIAVLTRLLLDREKAAAPPEPAPAPPQAPQHRPGRATRAAAALRAGRGWAAVRSRLGLGRRMADMRRSGRFDADWYLRTYPDVTASGADPLRHYLQFGKAEGRRPNGGSGAGD